MPGNLGIPIGNLTSQIFANIYLNELDRFIVHQLKPIKYLRYGDDFIVIASDNVTIEDMRPKIIDFLGQNLKLTLNPKNDIIVKVKHGLHFLGVHIFPKGRRLNTRAWLRSQTKLNYKNIGSYYGLVRKHSKAKKIKALQWHILETFKNHF